MLQNGSYDLLDLLARKKDEQTQEMFQSLTASEESFEQLIAFSPYFRDLAQISVGEILLVSEYDYDLADHSRRLVAKLRENTDNFELYYMEMMSSEQQFERDTFITNFIISSTFKRHAHNSAEETAGSRTAKQDRAEKE